MAGETGSNSDRVCLLVGLGPAYREASFHIAVQAECVMALQLRPELAAACEPYAVAVRHHAGHPVLLCRAPPVAPDVLMVMRKRGAPNHAWHIYCAKATEALLPHGEPLNASPCPRPPVCPSLSEHPARLPVRPSLNTHAAVRQAVGADVQPARLYAWLSGVYRSFARLPAAEYAQAVGGGVTVEVSPGGLTSNAPESVNVLLFILTRQEALQAPLGDFVPAADEVLVRLAVKGDGGCVCEVVVAMPTFLTGSTDPDFSSERVPMRCGSCGEHPASKTCASCHLAWYCSRQCQLAAWPAHKKACKAARQVQAVLP